jgi:hypothetical protein
MALAIRYPLVEKRVKFLTLRPWRERIIASEEMALPEALPDEEVERLPLRRRQSVSLEERSVTPNSQTTTRNSCPDYPASS